MGKCDIHFFFSSLVKTVNQKAHYDDSRDYLRKSSSKMAGNRERTFIMIKPDAVHRGLVGDIIKRFEQKGFKLVAMKMTHASEELLKEHYGHLSSMSFFPKIIEFMNSGPVVPMVWEGLNVVK